MNNVSNFKWHWVIEVNYEILILVVRLWCSKSCGGNGDWGFMHADPCWLRGCSIREARGLGHSYTVIARRATGAVEGYVSEWPCCSIDLICMCLSDLDKYIHTCLWTLVIIHYKSVSWSNLNLNGWLMHTKSTRWRLLLGPLWAKGWNFYKYNFFLT